MAGFLMGSGLAIRLPAAVVEALGLREGDDVVLCGWQANASDREKS